ncbi:MAG TPA: ABC transporter ATP-binding protein [Pseudoduganella sp.]|jgi:ABC-type multidrug transport system ATPase subunit
MLTFERLDKSFGNKTILHQAGAHFAPGIHALRGPNGVGKSTLLRMLAGIVQPDSGAIHIGAHSLMDAPLAAKACLSYVPDECPVYPFMSGREFLHFVAWAKGCKVDAEVMAIARQLGLATHLDTRFAAMSLGTQKKTMLAAAWIGAPVVMLFDEPSNGLDAAAREVLIDLMRGEGGRCAMLVSTHDDDFIVALGARVVRFEALSGAPAAERREQDAQAPG